MTGWQLRPAVADDVHWLAELRAVVLREHLVRLDEFDEDEVRERLHKGFSADRTSVIVVDGVDVGCVALRPADDGDVWLEHFYLRPDLQGQGIGGGVVTWAIQQTAGRTLRLSVLEASPAGRLYGRHGFVAYGSDGVDILMVRD